MLSGAKDDDDAIVKCLVMKPKMPLSIEAVLVAPVGRLFLLNLNRSRESSVRIVEQIG